MGTHIHTDQVLQRGTVSELIERINHISVSIDRITQTVANLRHTHLTVQQQKFLDELESESQKLQAERQHIIAQFNFNHTPQQQTNQLTTSGNTIAGTRILLVEDDIIIRTVAINILKRNGAEIAVAVNGKEATELAAAGKFDIILMDMQMPVMDGFDASRIIRFRQKCATPIIALTANSTINGEELYYEAGMNDVMSKPYNQEKLINIIRKWINPQVTNETGSVNQTETSATSLFDLKKLRGIGNPDFVNRMLRLFVDQVSPAVPAIRKAYDEKDFATVRYTTHRIRPSILNMGIDSVKSEIFEIEELAKSNESNPVLNDMISKLEDVMAQVTTEVRKLL